MHLFVNGGKGVAFIVVEEMENPDATAKLVFKMVQSSNKISNMIVSVLVFCRCCIRLGSKIFIGNKMENLFNYCTFLVLSPPPVLRDFTLFQ